MKEKKDFQSINYGDIFYINLKEKSKIWLHCNVFKEKDIYFKKIKENDDINKYLFMILPKLKLNNSNNFKESNSTIDLESIDIDKEKDKVNNIEKNKENLQVNINNLWQEYKENEKIIEKTKGNPVEYYNCFHLFHIITGKFLSMDTQYFKIRKKKLLDLDKLNVILTNTITKFSIFKFIPSLKFQKERQKYACYNDSIIISLNFKLKEKEPKIIIPYNIKEDQIDQIEKKDKKIYLNFYKQNTLILNYFNNGLIDNNCIKYNNLFKIIQNDLNFSWGSKFYKIQKNLLYSDLLLNKNVKENIELNYKNIDTYTNRINSNFLSNYFIIENIDIQKGGILNCDSTFKLKNFINDYYLYYDEINKKMIYSNEFFTEFKFIPINKNYKDNIEYSEYYIIKDNLNDCILNIKMEKYLNLVNNKNYKENNIFKLNKIDNTLLVNNYFLKNLYLKLIKIFFKIKIEFNETNKDYMTSKKLYDYLNILYKYLNNKEINFIFEGIEQNKIIELKKELLKKELILDILLNILNILFTKEEWLLIKEIQIKLNENEFTKMEFNDIIKTNFTFLDYSKEIIIKFQILKFYKYFIEILHQNNKEILEFIFENITIILKFLPYSLDFLNLIKKIYTKNKKTKKLIIKNFDKNFSNLFKIIFDKNVTENNINIILNDENSLLFKEKNSLLKIYNHNIIKSNKKKRNINIILTLVNYIINEKDNFFKNQFLKTLIYFFKINNKIDKDIQNLFIKILSNKEIKNILLLNLVKEKDDLKIKNFDNEIIKINNDKENKNIIIFLKYQLKLFNYLSYNNNSFFKKILKEEKIKLDLNFMLKILKDKKYKLLKKEITDIIIFNFIKVDYNLFNKLLKYNHILLPIKEKLKFYKNLKKLIQKKSENNLLKKDKYNDLLKYCYKNYKKLINKSIKKTNGKIENNFNILNEFNNLLYFLKIIYEVFEYKLFFNKISSKYQLKLINLVLKTINLLIQDDSIFKFIDFFINYFINKGYIKNSYSNKFDFIIKRKYLKNYISNDNNLDEEFLIKNYMLINNYKNQIYNISKFKQNNLNSGEEKIIKIQVIIYEILNNYLNRRMNLLILNAVEWFNNIKDKIKNIKEEDLIDNFLVNEVKCIFPNIIKTGNNKLDKFIKKNNFFMNIINHENLKPFENELGYNLKKNKFYPLLTQLIFFIINLNSKFYVSKEKFLELIIRLYNQRNELRTNLLKLNIIEDKKNKSIFKTMIKFNKYIVILKNIWKTNNLKILLKNYDKLIKNINKIKNIFFEENKNLLKIKLNVQNIFLKTKFYKIILKLIYKINKNINFYLIDIENINKEYLLKLFEINKLFDKILYYFTYDNKINCKIILKNYKYILDYLNIPLNQDLIFNNIFEFPELFKYIDFKFFIKKFVNFIKNNGKQIRFLTFLINLFKKSKNEYIEEKLYFLKQIFKIEKKNDIEYLFYLNSNRLEYSSSFNFILLKKYLKPENKFSLIYNNFNYNNDYFLFEFKILNIISSCKYPLLDRAMKYFKNVYKFEYLIELLSEEDLFFNKYSVNLNLLLQKIYNLNENINLNDDYSLIGISLLKSQIIRILFKFYLNKTSDLIINIKNNLDDFFDWINSEFIKVNNFDDKDLFISIEYVSYLNYFIKILNLVMNVNDSIILSKFIEVKYNFDKFILNIFKEKKKFTELLTEKTSNFILEFFLNSKNVSRFELNDEINELIKNFENLILNHGNEFTEVIILTDHYHNTIQKIEKNIQKEEFVCKEIHTNYWWFYIIDFIYSNESIKNLIEIEKIILCNYITNFNKLTNISVKNKYKIKFDSLDILNNIIEFLKYLIKNQKNYKLIFDILFLIKIIIKSDYKENIILLQECFRSMGLIKLLIELLIILNFENDKEIFFIFDILNLFLKDGNKYIKEEIYNILKENKNFTIKIINIINYFINNVIKINFESKINEINQKIFIKIIKFIKLCCENNEFNFKNLFRNQNNNKSINILNSLMNIFNIIILKYNRNSSKKIENVLKTVNELIQGPCIENQLEILNNEQFLNSFKKILIKNKSFIKYHNEKLESNFSKKDIDPNFNYGSVVKSKFNFIMNLKEIKRNLLPSKLIKKFKDKRVYQNDLHKIKYLIFLLLNNWFEKQKDEFIFNHIINLFSTDLIINNLIEIYSDYIIEYGNDFKLKSLNLFNLKKKQKKYKIFSKSNGVLIESGFYLFIILWRKLNYERDKPFDKFIFQLINYSKIIKKETKEYIFDKNISKQFFIDYNLENLSEIDDFMEINNYNFIYDLIKEKSNINYKIFPIIKETINFFSFYSSKIEIERNNELENVYFYNLPFTLNLSKNLKDKFHLEVERISQTTKISYLMSNYYKFRDNMIIGYILKNFFLTKFIHLNIKKLKYLYLFIGILINFLYLTSIRLNDEDISEYGENFFLSKTNSNLLFNIWLSFLLFIIWLILIYHYFSFIFLFIKTFKRYFNTKKLNLKRKIIIYFFNSIYFLFKFVSTWDIFYYTLSFCFLISAFFYKIFVAILFIEYVNSFELIKNILKSITISLSPLAYTFGLFILLVFLLSILIFKYFHNEFNTEQTETDLYNCLTLLTCFFYTYDYSFKFTGGVYASFDKEQRFLNITQTLTGFISFFIINLIILNIVVGIIIDSFANLRNKFNEIENDKNNFCFICNLNKNKFIESVNKTFYEHINEDHYMWDYIYYIIYLEKKPNKELNGIENYVFNQFLTKNFNWIPCNKTKSLENLKNKDDELVEKLENIKSNNLKILNHFNINNN